MRTAETDFALGASLCALRARGPHAVFGLELRALRSIERTLRGGRGAFGAASLAALAGGEWGIVRLLAGPSAGVAWGRASTDGSFRSRAPLAASLSLEARLALVWPRASTWRCNLALGGGLSLLAARFTDPAGDAVGFGAATATLSIGVEWSG
ncbi:MAG: hypothetical protein AAF938_02760 [Myxococcota bacterium]